MDAAHAGDAHGLVGELAPDQERHFVEYLGSGHTVWIKGPDGVIVTIEQSLMGVGHGPRWPTPRAPRPMTREERLRGIEATIDPVRPGSALQSSIFRSRTNCPCRAWKRFGTGPSTSAVRLGHRAVHALDRFGPPGSPRGPISKDKRIHAGLTDQTLTFHAGFCRPAPERPCQIP